MKRISKGFIATVLAVSLCLVITESYATLEPMLDEHNGIFRIHTYTTGVLKYNASELSPRTGPGFEYEAEEGLDLEKGSEVTVFTITAKDEYLWVSVECETAFGKIWTYLLYEDPSLGKTMDIADIRKVKNEYQPNRSHNGCGYSSDSIRKGPGYQYPEKIQKTEYKYYPTVVATCQGWVLLEFERDNDRIELDNTEDISAYYARGWVPLRAIDQF